MHVARGTRRKRLIIVFYNAFHYFMKISSIPAMQDI